MIVLFTVSINNVVLMLGQRRRRWPNIKPALGEHHVCYDDDKQCINMFIL